jgi:hypothetical protein
VVERDREERGEDELRILQAMKWDERHLLPVYEGQALPSPPYSLADLLQYIRLYICQALSTTCSLEFFSST